MSIEPTIGPYEVYEDEWFNYKAAFESYVTVQDETESSKLQKFAGELQDIENHLPIDPALRNPKLGAMAPIVVVNEIFAAGDGNRAVQTAAFNLPNDERVREASARLRRTGINFIGNVEPKDVLSGRADVVVADGFVGNVAIKMAEATAELIFRSMRDEVPRTLRGKAGGLLIRPAVSRIRARMDWREFGGAPLLGIDGVAVVAHGRSDALAIKNAVRTAAQAVGVDLVSKIREALGK